MPDRPAVRVKQSQQSQPPDCWLCLLERDPNTEIQLEERFRDTLCALHKKITLLANDGRDPKHPREPVAKTSITTAGPDEPTDRLTFSPIEKRLAYARVRIETSEPQGDDIAFLHSGLTQIVLPRRPLEDRRYEVTNGKASLVIHAGELWDGELWIPQPLPSGTKPRLVLLDLCTQATRTKDRRIDVERSARAYLKRLGLGGSGGHSGPLRGFRRAVGALAACRMQLGLVTGDTVGTVNRQFISGIDNWVTHTRNARVPWPREIVLDTDFHASLRRHAVPLDWRAVQALSDSALALDIYNYMTHRLCRLRRPLTLRWTTLKQQFGRDYGRLRDFRRDFLRQLKRVLAVYPPARVREKGGRMTFNPAPPPVAHKRD